MSENLRNDIKATLAAGEISYSLRLSMNIICDIEDEFDLGINQLIAKFSEPASLRMSDIRRFLMHCIMVDGGKADREQASAICDIAGHRACSEATAALLIASFATTVK